MTMNKGFLITIYGINNIGKSTHAKKLVDKLKAEGFEAVYVKYPVYYLEPTGPKINSIIRSSGAQTVSEEELQTLFMQNRADFEPTINKWIDEGKIVVAEDYKGTGIAWGTAKGLDQKWVEELNGKLRKEDFVILMTGKRDMNAKEKTHLHESDDALVEKAGEILKSLAEKNGWHTVEVRENIADTAAVIWQEVNDFLKGRN